MNNRDNAPWLTIVPAYNRDYKSEADVLIDWERGFDFQIQDISCKHTGRYVNRNDAEAYAELKNTVFKVRYDSLAEIALIRWSIDDERWGLWNGGAIEEEET